MNFLSRLILISGLFSSITLCGGENEYDMFGLPEVDIRFLNPSDIDGPCIDAKIYPWSWVDGRFFMLQEEMVPMCISLANPKQIKNPNPRLIMDLPKGVELTGSVFETEPPRKIKTGNGRVVWSVPIPEYFCSVYKKHQRAPMMRVGLYCKIPVEKFPSDSYMSYYYKDDKVSQPPQKIGLGVLPSPPVAKKTPLFKLGVCLSFVDLYMKGTQLNLWADLLSRTGISFATVSEAMIPVKPGVDRNISHYYRAFRKHDIKVFLEPFYLGGWVFDMGYWLFRDKLPPEGKFIRLDETVAPKMASTRWIAKSPEFRQKLYEYLRTFLVDSKRCDSFCVNWEPFPSQMMDYSDETLEDLARFAGKDPKEIKRIGRVPFIRQNKKLLIPFRNKRLGEVMDSIYTVLYRLEKETGQKIDLMPYVNADLRVDYNNYPGDIGKSARIIAPFEYPALHFFLKDAKGYVNSFSDRFPTYVSLLKKHRQWARNQNPESPPEMYHCADFNGSLASICPPAQLRLQVLLDMFFGYRAAFFYRFYSGYDGRYYYSIAKIADEVSKLAPYLSSQKLKYVERIKAEGYPLKSVKDINEGKWRTDFVGALMLSDGSYQVASVFNLQERWEAVAKVVFSDLKEEFYSVYDPLNETQLVLDGKSKISAKNLMKGFYIKMHPNDARFWALEKWKGSARFARTFSPKPLGDIFEKSQKDWVVLQSRMNKTVPAKKGKIVKLNIPPQENDKFKLSSKSSFLVIECSGQTFKINTAKGATLSSWEIDGKETVRGNVMLRDRLWEEKKDIWKKGFANSVYRVDDITLSEDSLVILFSCDYPHQKVRLNKKYKFTAGKKIDIFTRLENTGKEIITLAYWLENWPLVLDREKTGDGEWYIPSSGKVFKANASLLSSFYITESAGRDDLEALKPYTLQFQENKISRGESMIYSPASKRGLEFIFPIDKVAFFYSWDSLNSTFQTWDIIFKHVTLQSGESWDTKLILKSIDGDKEFKKVLNSWQ